MRHRTARRRHRLVYCRVRAITVMSNQQCQKIRGRSLLIYLGVV